MYALSSASDHHPFLVISVFHQNALLLICLYPEIKLEGVIQLFNLVIGLFFSFQYATSSTVRYLQTKDQQNEDKKGRK